MGAVTCSVLTGLEWERCCMVVDVDAGYAVLRNDTNFLSHHMKPEIPSQEAWIDSP
jgi:hypothetical protein